MKIFDKDNSYMKIDHISGFKDKYFSFNSKTSTKNSLFD
jgi:hypothetical protein